MQIELREKESEVKIMQDGFHSESKSDTTRQVGDGGRDQRETKERPKWRAKEYPSGGQGEGEEGLK